MNRSIELHPLVLAKDAMLTELQLASAISIKKSSLVSFCQTKFTHMPETHMQKISSITIR